MSTKMADAGCSTVFNWTVELENAVIDFFAGKYDYKFILTYCTRFEAFTGRVTTRRRVEACCQFSPHVVIVFGPSMFKCI